MNAIRHRFVVVVLFVAIVVTIITQLPFFLERNLNIVGVIVWIPLIICLLFLNAIKINSCVYFPITCFLGYSFLLFLFNSFFNVSPVTSCFFNFAMSVGIFLIGFFLANILRETDFIRAVVYASLIGCIAYVIVLKNTVFYIVDIDSVTYVYGAKNSASRIIYTCFVLVLLLYRPRYKVTIILKYISILFFVYMIFLMKSRSTILALIVPVMVFMIYGNNKKNVYIFVSVVIVLCICFPDYVDVIYHKIILNNKVDADLDTISSGRLWMIKNFFDVFGDYALFGGSSFFVENFYLITLLEMGSIGAIPVFMFLLWFCIILKKYFDFANQIDITCLILLITYYIDGLFEATAPFGPGAKCFFLWLIIGFFINKRMLAYN